MKTVGLIPAAGRGTRLLPFRYPKELFPIAYVQPTPEGETVQLRVVCQDALDSLVAARVSRAFVVISDQKFEVMRFLSDGSEFGIDLAFLHQREVSGLPGAIDCAYPWTRESNVVLLLPDTVHEPRNSVAGLLSFLDSSGADIALGVFPARNPGDLCPVEFDGDGRVLALYDKDGTRGIMNTWGIAAWKPSFSEFVHSHLSSATRKNGEEASLAEVIMAAVRAGLTARAFPVPDGQFVDIGRRPGLIEARDLIGSRLGREHPGGQGSSGGA